MRFLEGRAGLRFRWPNNVMPYIFDATMDSAGRTAIERTAKIFNEQLEGCFQIRQV